MAAPKNHLTKYLRDPCGVRVHEAERLFDALLEQMKSILESGEDILLSSSGKFCVRETPARRGAKSSDRGRSDAAGEARGVIQAIRSVEAKDKRAKMSLQN